MEFHDELVFQISLTHVPNIGAVHARALLEKIGSAKKVFHASSRTLESIEGIGAARAQNIRRFQDFGKAEREIQFLSKYQVKPLFILDEAYPRRLLNCYDPPTILFYKGHADLNAPRIVSIVGTRKNSEYGKAVTEKLVRDLSSFNVVIVSGLAFGIDTVAHKAAIKNAVPTVAVLAHGLHTIYPFDNAALAREMIAFGGLLSEFASGTDPDKHNFPSRNRVVAGISDAVIVVETGLKGGSMITAELANSYNRDVFAVPGRTNDPKSEGCIELIRSNKAVIFRDCEELVNALGWENQQASPAAVQPELFISLTDSEKQVFDLIRESDTIHVDELITKATLAGSRLSAILLNLELQGLIACLPGKSFKSLR